MRMCDDKHDELAYDDRRHDCPACDAMATAAGLAERLATAENVRDVLSDRVDAAEERALELAERVARAAELAAALEVQLAQQRMASHA